MTMPGVPLEIITPEGRPAYLDPYTGAYTTNRAYALRLQRGRAAGLSKAEARGHAARPAAGTPGGPPLSESQLRKLRFQERYGVDYNWWRRMQRKYVREINSMSSPAMQINVLWVIQELENQQNLYGFLGLGGTMIPSGYPWMERRLAEKLEDMRAYHIDPSQGRGSGPGSPGYDHFVFADSYHPIEWWYYHGT